MSKKKKDKNVVEIPAGKERKVLGMVADAIDGANALELAPSETELKTDKKTLNKTAKIVRRLDNIVTDLFRIEDDTHDLSNSISEIDHNQKDSDRIKEINLVAFATATILYQLTARMARKYVGKEIDSTLNGTRKSLKK